MNWLLVITLIIILLLMIHGWRKGMLRILFSIVAIVVLIVLVAFATPHISGFIKEHTGVYTALEERCTEKFQQQAGEEAGQSAESVFAAAGISFPEKVTSYLQESSADLLENTGIGQAIGQRTADLILSGASFLIALILAVILVKLIDHALKIVDHIPILKGINRGLGLLAGIFEAYILISLFFLFVALIAGTEAGKLLTGFIDESRFLSFLYDQNILWKFLSK